MSRTRNPHVVARAERLKAQRLANPRKRGIWSSNTPRIAASVKPKRASAEQHRRKMARKAARRETWHREAVGFFARQIAQGAKVPPNASRHPGGKKRTAAPRNSIWPEGKVAEPGRMG
ncbi:MAG TPA: hypothetical protein VFW19_10760 [Allosphingosinicella sp.]|nr:hypothetical protein [Allosphingosinicella sp.]